MAAGRNDAAASAAPLPFVKKWVRTRRAVLFRLSTRCVQVAFTDGTCLVLTHEGGVATLIDRNGHRSAHHVGTAIAAARAAFAGGAGAGGASPGDEAAGAGSSEPAVDLARRLRYARDVLSQLIAGGNAPAGGAGSAGR
jgi:hypothetical protein